MCVPQALGSSFRDPSGFMFVGEDGNLYRQVNRRYQADFEQLHSSGLYDELVKHGLLVEHTFADHVSPISADGFRVIRPRRIPFISYPYEWAFSALQDAALLTLDVQLRALSHNMQLKDASAFNIQFEGCKPVLIDTLSLERLDVDQPWKAYGQFCRHFLAPLALMSKTHIDAGLMLRDFIDGLPLGLASRMLPARTRLSLGIQLHLHWHAKMVARHESTAPVASTPSAGPSGKARTVRMPLNQLRAYLQSLRNLVAKLKWRRGVTEWGDYYDDNSYSASAAEEKRAAVAAYLKLVKPTTVWDLGANTGVYSRIASEVGGYTCAFDIDPSCIEQAYRNGRDKKLTNFLPLRLDLTNPSPALGWAHQERESLAERGPADTIMALALIHHLAISNNVPFPEIAEFFAKLGKALIIEFVPKQDPQVRRLLQNREDIFDGYHQEGFELAFARRFEFRESQSIGSDGRRLYLMVRRDSREPATASRRD